jgi:DNA repair photolyase
VKPQPIANPPNPWSSGEVEYLEEAPRAKPFVYADHSQAIVSENDSPDVGFSYSLNPYRGCMHACAYCYARRTHEYLSFGAGSDFDTKIAVKLEAAALLRKTFDRPSWKGEPLVFSGVTDCYQPLEASYRLTRACLEVCAEYRNPVGIITKAPLIERDLDVLATLHREAQVKVRISIPLWDQERARAIEPGVATPKRRLLTIERLAKAGIPVGINVAPIIPGLDDDVGRLLRAAREAGATSAGYVLLRLPGSVKDVFEARLKAALPLSAEKVLHRIRETRGGALYDLRFGVRGRGEGNYAQALATLFTTTCRSLGLSVGFPGTPGPSTFRRPEKPVPQLSLF